MTDARPIGVVRADWERWHASPVTGGVDYVTLRDTLIHDVPALLDRIEELKAALDVAVEAVADRAKVMAKGIVLAAPTLTYGTRLAGHPGGFPAVFDGPPDERGEVHCNYGLRDAMLGWIDERITPEGLGIPPVGFSGTREDAE